MAEADTDIQFDRDKCVICLDISRDCDEKHIEITAKGLETFTRYSKLRGNDKLYSYLCNWMYTQKKNYILQLKVSRSSGNTTTKVVLPDDLENVKLLVAKCSFSSVYTSYVLLYFTY